MGRLVVAGLWLVVLVLMVFAYLRGSGLYREWHDFKAKTGVAVTVSEESVVQYDPVLGWKHIPGGTASMELAESGQTILVQINSHGFRGARDYDVSKPSDHDRVIA